MPKIGNKNAFLGLFWARILKDCLIAKFWLKQKLLIFGEKITC